MPDLSNLVQRILEGTQEFENGFPINLEGYWTVQSHISGAEASTGTNYDSFAICPFSTVRVDEAWCIVTTPGTDAGAVTCQLERKQGTEAKNAGDDLLATAFNLKATANSLQQGALVSDFAVRTLSKGDRLGLVNLGTLTAVGNVLVVVKAKILTF